MTKKETILMQVTKDVTKYGHIQNETNVLLKGIRCSKDLVMKATYQGRKLRDEMHEKHHVWQLQDINWKAREVIRRHLSCGERLDTPEAQIIIDNYHLSLDTYKNAIKELEKDLEAL